MFRLLRVYSVTSVAGVIAVAVMLAVFWQNAMDQLVEYAENQNVALTRSVSNTIWPRFASYVTTASSLSPDALRASPETAALRVALWEVSAGIPVLKIKIYDLDGFTVYSSESTEIGLDKSTNPGFFAAAREGRPASKLTYRDSFSSFEGAVQDRDLVESYLPIRHRGGPVEGVFELYTDVTPLVTRVQSSTGKLIAGVAVIFVALYGILFLLVRRAERTLADQYIALKIEVGERKQAETDLTEARDDLERSVRERTRELTDEIADRRKAENEARQHRAALAHVGRVSTIAEMATSLAHELNQPLTVISGCGQVCRAELRKIGERNQQHDESQTLADAVEQITEQAERATEIVRHIRGFVHKKEPKRRMIDINAAVRDVGSLLQPDAREHDATIILELANTLPPVTADLIQIQQVVVNLAHNGMEAMSGTVANSREVTIRSTARDDATVEIAVEDRGPGIAAEIKDRIFDTFFTTKAEGLGMGLSISHSIIEAHGGRLWVSSDGTHGAVFKFTLPTESGGRADGA